MLDEEQEVQPSLCWIVPFQLVNEMKSFELFSDGQCILCFQLCFSNSLCLFVFEIKLDVGPSLQESGPSEVRMWLRPLISRIMRLYFFGEFIHFDRILSNIFIETNFKLQFTNRRTTIR